MDAQQVRIKAHCVSQDIQLVEMGRSYGLRGWSLYRDIILPGALPSILVGVRFSLGFMWVILIVAETISAQSGIGYMTMNAREFLQTDVVLLGILLYALLGKLADVAARLLERVIRAPHPSVNLAMHKRKLSTKECGSAWGPVNRQFHESFCGA